MSLPSISAAGTLPATISLGAVTLGVADLERSVAYYRDRLGLQVLSRAGDVARLGAGEQELLVLREEPGARPFPAQGATGLYHVALLLPTRAALARFLVHLSREQTAVVGLSDHLVSEAIYLTDPDGNGIEVYADRPRSTWPRDPDGTLRMATLPLDTDAVIAELEGEEPAPGFTVPDATVIGHVHLHVADVAAAERFYTEVVGFSPIVRFGGVASFVSAGGYHHHLGMNTWAGPGASPAPSGTAGLRHFEIAVSDDDARAALLERLETAGVSVMQVDGGPAFRDPSENVVVVLDGVRPPIG